MIGIGAGISAMQLYKLPTIEKSKDFSKVI